MKIRNRHWSDALPSTPARLVLRLGRRVALVLVAGKTEIVRRSRPIMLAARGLSECDRIFTQTTADEKDTLYRLARRVEGGVAVEIGSASGASSCFIAAGLGKRGTLHCVDRWNIEYRRTGETVENYLYEPDGRLVRYEWDEQLGGIRYEDVGRVDGDCPTWTTFLANTARFKTIVPVRRESSEAAKDFEHQIDLLFIDGWHEYEQVVRDTDAWLPKVKAGGWVAYHDHGWAEGVQRVVRQRVAPRAIESGLLPNMFWARLGDP